VCSYLSIVHCVGDCSVNQFQERSCISKHFQREDHLLARAHAYPLFIFISLGMHSLVLFHFVDVVLD
jgi:hypothetical protein